MPPKHIYVHVPFCARRCSYCDFAIAVRREVPVDTFVSGIEREIDLRFPDQRQSVETIYLGGGTPSRLGHDGVRRLLDAVRRAFVPTADAEITIEVNPEDVTGDVAHRWRDAGVTRVSLGAQSFDDEVLRWMHRVHGADQIAAAANALVEARLDDWSMDLIFALPPEVPRDWSQDLRRAIDLNPPHLSCYGLTIESHTPLNRWRDRGLVHEAADERYEEDFLATHRVLTERGYEHYEVSNYALPGRRARHNSAYWRRVPYAGFGPSAHSFDGASRRWNAREYAEWLRRVHAGTDPVEGREVLAPESVATESQYLGLRSDLGIPVTPANAAQLSQWSDRGWATVVDGIGRLTPQGWLRLDALVASLTDIRSHY